MALGVSLAVLAAVLYGMSSVFQALGARRSAARKDVKGAATTTKNGAPSLASTVLAFFTPLFLLGTFFDVVGFAGGAVATRLIPLFLSQTIVSGNLVMTAILGVFILHIPLHKRDWAAIVVVIISLALLGVATGHHGTTSGSETFHWALLGAAIAVSVVVELGVLVMGNRASLLAGAGCGVLFGIVAIGVRVLRGVTPFNIVTLLTDPAAWAIAVAGAMGFYLHAVALQLGNVNGATALLVVGETVVPGLIGVLMLGDSFTPGLLWLGIICFLGAIAGSVAVALFGAATLEEEHAKESTDGKVAPGKAFYKPSTEK